MEIATEEQLPINIEIGSELIAIFPNIARACERLSARLNFQTMASGWYGDEENILSIILSLEITPIYEAQKALFEAEGADDSDFFTFSDDVCYCFKKSVDHINVLVAITDAELTLLQTNEQILKKYLDTKLVKVVNLVANRLSLVEIPA